MYNPATSTEFQAAIQNMRAPHPQFKERAAWKHSRYALQSMKTVECLFSISVHILNRGYF